MRSLHIVAFLFHEFEIETLVSNAPIVAALLYAAYTTNYIYMYLCIVQLECI